MSVQLYLWHDHIKLLVFMFCLQKELIVVIDMALKLYCEDIPQEGDKSPVKMQEFIEKAMEHVRKEHYLAFCKHFPIYDPSLGTKFLQEIQAHYDNNLEFKMLTKKFQMFVYFAVSKEQKNFG